MTSETLPLPVPKKVLWTGRVLLTGYLGGATATHVRIGDSFIQIVSPVIGGVLVWGALYLRDVRLRALVPLRN